MGARSALPNHPGEQGRLGGGGRAISSDRFPYLDRLIAMIWTSTPGTSASGTLLDRDNGFVTIEWGGMVVVGAYVSPNSGRAALDSFLDGARDCVSRYLPRQVLVLGDINAHAMQCGNSRTDARGRALLDWAAGFGLLLVNRGSASSCVVWRGCSVIDLT